MIFKIDDNTFIKFDESTKVSKTIFKDEMEREAEVLTNAKLPSDEELIAWAKENMPQVKVVEQDLKEAVILTEQLKELEVATEVSLSPTK